ncbi:MAG: isocitrate lyase/phosphoenolpyruvate mutase family protein, partial [Actinomycetota bacterium]|nr:isocitrate lyase/phosphoenolpyruvate mutase family protein [Actinomycetota bacterium]
MHDRSQKAANFLALHQQEGPLLMANAWDAGSATLFGSLGFQAIATTSSGHAATLGRLDYAVS